jgi:uncharacterized membrane protein YfbV (UPF0208 family)
LGGAEKREGGKRRADTLLLAVFPASQGIFGVGHNAMTMLPEQIAINICKHIYVRKEAMKCNRM